MIFKFGVYEIIIDLTQTSSRYTYHGDEQSGSTVLFLLHSIGVDYELVTFQVGSSGDFQISRMLPSTVRKVHLSPASGIVPHRDRI